MGFGLVIPMGSCTTVFTCPWWGMALFVSGVSIALSVYCCSTMSLIAYNEFISTLLPSFHDRPYASSGTSMSGFPE